MDASQWIAKSLIAQGEAVTAISTVKERPWSTVWRVINATGPCYFKAGGANGGHESSLFKWLHAQEFGTLIPDVIAMDEAQEWLLLADAGTPWRDLPNTPERWHLLEILLPQYSALQQASIDQIASLLNLGIPDRRLAELPQLVDMLVETWHTSGLMDTPLRQELQQARPLLEQICTSLETSAYSTALDHGDFHIGNVLVSDHQPRLCDWGDACVTHPFYSLYPLLEMTQTLDAGGNLTPVGKRLRDIYLESWTVWAPLKTLQQEFAMAMQTAPLLRALDMAYMLEGAELTDLRTWAVYGVKQLSRWIETAKTLPSNVAVIAHPDKPTTY